MRERRDGRRGEERRRGKGRVIACYESI